jgi:hypothetical protein
MKYYYLLITFFLIFSTNESVAQQPNFGLGIIIGGPTGISAKLWTSDINAFDFGLGWSAINHRDHSRNNVHFHMDYLWHSFNAIRSAERFPLYYGIGGGFSSYADNESSIAVRGVFGIAWLPHQTPIDIFLEVAPSLELTPSTGVFIDAAIGIRYYF